jgi:nicotinamidase-related amidase
MFAVIKINWIMTTKTFEKALLVIDIQENLVKPDSRMHIDVTNINQFFKNVNRTIDLFEKSGFPVLYITNEWSNFLLNWITGNVCKKGGKGVGLDSRLMRVNMKLYRKSTKSALLNTELLKDLQDWKVSEVFLVGLFAEHCVKATMMDALKEDFRVTVVTDGLGSKNEKNLRRSVEYFRSKKVSLVTADMIKSTQNKMTA